MMTNVPTEVSFVFSDPSHLSPPARSRLRCLGCRRVPPPPLSLTLCSPACPCSASTFFLPLPLALLLLLPLRSHLPFFPLTLRRHPPPLHFYLSRSPHSAPLTSSSSPSPTNTVHLSAAPPPHHHHKLRLPLPFLFSSFSHTRLRRLVQTHAALHTLMLIGTQGRSAHSLSKDGVRKARRCDRQAS